VGPNCDSEHLRQRQYTSWLSAADGIELEGSGRGGVFEGGWYGLGHLFMYELKTVER
jgi:hypothetical protein